MSIQSLGDLTGTKVKVNRGGPESEKGTLLAVRNDVLVLRPPKGSVIYYNLEHVKSVTGLKKTARRRDRRRNRNRNGIFPSWLTFRQLLSSFTDRYVQINRGGPEKVKGTIARVTANTVTLIHGKEVIRLPIHHIRTVNLLVANAKTGKFSRRKESG